MASTGVGLKCLEPRRMAAMRLVLIPYAGAGAGIFRDWARALPGSIEAYALQLPGREEHIAETAFTAWPDMIKAAVTALSHLPRSPLAFFGHSLGAVMALELARAVAAVAPARLTHVFCGARAWPGGAPTGEGEIHTAGDAAFLAALQDHYGALHPSFAEPEIRALTLPCLRADLQLLNSYRWRASPPLPAPLTVYAGCEDPATKAADLTQWRCETSNTFNIVEFPDGHFFLDTQRAALISDISTCLSG